jgi:hypothetical protein
MKHRTIRRLTFLLLIGLFALANLLMPGLFWKTGGTGLLFTAGILCSGGLVAEVCVLAVWGAMAAKPLKHRLPISAGLVLAGACSYILGLQLPDSPNSDMPLVVALVIIGLSLAMYAGLFVPMWIVRCLTGKRIALPSEVFSRPGEQGSAQFGLRYLLMCPVVLSGVIILLQYSLPRDEHPLVGSFVGILEVLFVVAFFMVFAALICSPCIWLVLTEKRRWPWALWLGMVWVGGPWGISTTLAWRFSSSFGTWESLLNIYSFGSGLMVTTLLVLFVFRNLGYRLVGRPSGCPFGAIIAETGETPPSELSPPNSEVQ